jgi:hypothetical protein
MNTAMTSPVPALLADILERYCNVNAFPEHWPQNLKIELSNNPLKEEQFRHELADAIMHDTITPDQYEKLTDEEFDTQQELNVWLRSLWQTLYDDQPLPLSETGTRG